MRCNSLVRLSSAVDRGRRAALLALLAAVALGGCVPSSMIEGVPWVTRKHGTEDASLQRAEHWPCIRFDAVLLGELAETTEVDDLDSAQVGVRDVLARAHRTSIASTRNELDRLCDEGWAELDRRYFEAEATPGGPDTVQKDRIWRAYLERTEQRFESLTQQVDAATSLDELRELVEVVLADIEASIKTRGRFARALPWAVFSIPSAMVVDSIHDKEYMGPLDRAFDVAVEYVPRGGVPAAGPGGEGDARIWALVNRHAPILVQEINPSADYESSIDSFGAVAAVTEDDIVIDTTMPTVYAYGRELAIGGRRCSQLVYTFWYPVHPPLHGGIDPEAGKIDGSVLRITLDASERPIMFETMLACGCYHRAYPSERLEQLALNTYGAPEDGKRFAIERDVAGSFDLIVPELVPDAPDMAARPVVRAAAGYHALIDVAFDHRERENEPHTMRGYVVDRYEALERLPSPHGHATSMFQGNGLVKGAERLEGVFFTPLEC